MVQMAIDYNLLYINTSESMQIPLMRTKLSYTLQITFAVAIKLDPSSHKFSN